MSRPIRLNAFAMNCVGHLAPGLWAHPRDQSHRYRELTYWMDLARLLEQGLFDALFLADVNGIYDVYGGKPDTAIRNAVQVPVNDPLQIVPAMAAVTRHLGFGITCSTASEHPFPFARRMSTLDHLTGGRAAWNIVTSFLASGAKSLGQDRLTAHDDRYAYADDYLDVCYKLWEESWADGAVIADKARGIYADPALVRPVQHQGPHFTVEGIHLSEPSPQRTPVLFQAGASGRGRLFAATHAECVFIGGPSRTVLKGYVKAIREQAAALGRDPRDLVIYNLHTVILGRTEREAREKLEDYRAHASLEAGLALLSGWTGIDLSQYDPDDPFRRIHTEAGQSAIDSFTSADPNKVWTIRELAQWAALGGRGPVSVGTAASVADELQAWAAETGVDGFNLAFAVMPETFTDVIEHLIPELQRRGVYQTAYAEGTLRQKLFGRGDRLRSPHPAAGHRQALSA
ncbi:LLM class flavin-dependent oxidoreductase [Zavarzinia compransoris]|uniref:5,10-methylene tetrahydromethanopterin reductase n=1 Tax=Zavarzinia compransoris TaxID=1264899 RepID=A0A317DSZ9_9PROT|nr:LLM class flavin-dependent oxidoreductase [Zavarzinia compransoris]PWR17808.1 5,10-methylene tetrahydromethanopterin reductase [Zavarzinia compransoris]TDP49341.1 FMN-dependent oxidoreductase (nitrilotriacetate monooxygenase family) [Zavarzinia compransoris]